MPSSAHPQKTSGQIPVDIHFSENPDPVKFLSHYLAHSEFLSKIKLVNDGIFPSEQLRYLTPQEIKVLLDQKNYARDWDTIKVTRDFTPEGIINNQFLGNAVIGRMTGVIHLDDLSHPCGIINSTLYNVQIAGGTLVKNVHCLSDVALLPGAAVSNCNVVSHGNDHHFGIGREMALAIESGGREIKIFPEINIDVARILCRKRADRAMLAEYSSLIDQYIKAARSVWSVIAENGLAANTSKVVNFFLGAGAVIDNACAVENAVVLSDENEKVQLRDGAIIKNTMIQWGTEITTGAVVERAVFTEHSGAERHAKVLDSLIGANTTIAEGEVGSSLVGSFVGFHHQALLIAAYWPEGKGNISYGANVGSNHTGKKNDQEIWPGEGVFFGLDCAVKMPANYTESPYSIITTSCVTLPQKVTFPFSLINQPSVAVPGVSPAYNEIYPAWVLSDNIYMIMRNESKYRRRNKAKRIYIKFDIFRPSVIQKMIRARNILAGVQERVVYTDKHIPGLGKNFMLEAQRLNAVQTYTFYIRHFCLDTLFQIITAAEQPEKNLHILLQNDYGNSYWAFVRTIFASEIPESTDGKCEIKQLAAIFIQMKQDIADAVFISKQKDDIRGRLIIDDYEDAHVSAENDEFVLSMREQAENARELLKNI